ncbi:MAG: radical SAM protein, partial [Anaerolineaceae bacterium]|nr:radical SAM protein [Anaerolineaceae bacterium]
MQNKIDSGIFEYKLNIGEYKNRIHLRIEEDGHGVLLVNANQLYHFNPSAALMAHMVLEKEDDSAVVKQLQSTFHVKKDQALADFVQFKADLERIISPLDDFCPVCDLNLETFAPFSNKPSAPYRMDLALTYRCNNKCVHCYNESDRLKHELDVDQWEKILDRVWKLGIPHVVFTGGEPTLVPFLPELITYAEKLGMITGLNTNGRKFSDPAYIDALVSAGLDHVQITLESHDAEIHDDITAAPGAWAQTTSGITNALNSKLYVMTNTTLLRSNSASLTDTLDFLSALGVPTVGLNGLIYSGRGASVDESISENDLPALLEIAKAHAADSEQRLIWYTPTMYCHFNPIESNLGVKGCTAALYNMCIEPDGSVLPCQSYYRSLGNFLEDSWDSIWNHTLARSLRDRAYVPDSCRFCDLVDTCGAGCPLHLINNPEME